MKHAADQPPQATQTLRDLVCARPTGASSGRGAPRPGTLQRIPFVDRLVKYGVRLGGKRLRPALLLLSARVAGPVAARPPRPGGRGRDDPYRHAHPRRRARRGHAPPPPRHRQFPLEQRNQRPAGRLPRHPRHLPGQLGRGHVRLPDHRPGQPAPCARANSARSPAAATTIWPSRSTSTSLPTRRPP